MPPSPNTEASLPAVARQMDLPTEHGVQRLLTFFEYGPVEVRGLVRALCTALFPTPESKDNDDVTKWIKGIDHFFGGIPSNRGSVETIAWVTRRCLAQQVEAVLQIVAAQSRFKPDILAIIEREAGSKSILPPVTVQMMGSGGVIQIPVTAPSTPQPSLPPVGTKNPGYRPPKP